MSKDLTARLRAAIEQRQALAEAASPSPWSANAEGDEVVAVDGITVCDGFALSGRQLRATVSHIVANDPKTVLRRCRADLAILDEHKLKEAWPYTGPECGYGCRICALDDRQIQPEGVCRTVTLLAGAYGITEEET